MLVDILRSKEVEEVLAILVLNSIRPPELSILSVLTAKLTVFDKAADNVGGYVTEYVVRFQVVLVFVVIEASPVVRYLLLGETDVVT